MKESKKMGFGIKLIGEQDRREMKKYEHRNTETQVVIQRKSEWLLYSKSSLSLLDDSCMKILKE